MTKAKVTDGSRSPQEPIVEVHGNGPEIPSPDAPNDLDKYARFIATDVVTATTGASATCTLGTPGKTTFFRAHPDPAFYLHLHTLTYEGEGKRRTYLLDPVLLGLPELDGLTRIARTVPYITHHGALGLWLISIEYDDNPWIKSALNITEEAKTRWVAAVAVTKQSQYRKQYPTREFDEPAWPSLSRGEWLDLAFSPDAWITDRDHPILRKIRGE